MQTSKDRIALVTGANKGIDFEIARQLGQLRARDYTTFNRSPLARAGGPDRSRVHIPDILSANRNWPETGFWEIGTRLTEDDF
jgi:NAD(P)-dependent dehydrogenase (short-subunit alcohol dehydrogenase family)